MVLIKDDLVFLNERYNSATKVIADKIAYSGKKFCQSCQRAIPVDIVEREGFLYAIDRCSFENKKIEKIGTGGCPTIHLLRR